MKVTPKYFESLEQIRNVKHGALRLEVFDKPSGIRPVYYVAFRLWENDTAIYSRPSFAVPQGFAVDSDGTVAEILSLASVCVPSEYAAIVSAFADYACKGYTEEQIEAEEL